MPERSAFAKRLAAAVAGTGESQKAFARRLGVANTTLSRWTRGENEPDMASLAEICRLTDVSADEILGLPPRGPARLPDQVAGQLERQLEKVAQRREAVAEELEDLRRLVRGLSDKK